MRSLIVMLFCVVVLMNSGAGCLQNPACSLPVVWPGVIIDVVDARSGQAIANCTVTLTDGEYVEQGGAGGHFSGAPNRAGTYTLAVEAPGYVSRQLDNIVVESIPDECAVATVYLTVELTPAP